MGLSASELFDYRERSDVFDEVAAIWPITANLTGTTRPERVETILADINYFSLLGARPEIGRLFGPQDYQPGISPVVVISDGLWRRGFGGDPDVLGRTLRIDNDAVPGHRRRLEGLPSSEPHARDRRGSVGAKRMEDGAVSGAAAQPALPARRDRTARSPA